MLPASSKTTSSKTTVVFPDACKTPAPPAPPVPVPYPDIQYHENLKAANKVDAMAKTGNIEAQQKQKQAIDNLFIQTGIKATTASQAAMLGKTVHGTQPKKINIVQPQSLTLSAVSNASSSHHDILSSIINNLRA